MSPAVSLHRHRADMVEVRCTGRLDATASRDLRDALDLVTAVGRDDVLVELSRVESLEAPAGTVLAAAALAAARYGTRFTVVPPPDGARRFLDQSGLSVLLAS